MSMYESLKKAVKRTAKDAAKASGELVEKTKLKLKAADIKGDIEECYTKIGKLYYDMAENSSDNTDAIKSLLSEVNALYDALGEIEAQMQKD